MPATILSDIWRSSATNFQYAISIIDTTLTSADPGTMDLGPDAFTYKDNGDGKDLFKRIYTGDVSISIIINNPAVVSFYDSLVDSPEGRFYLKIAEVGKTDFFLGKILSAVQEVADVDRPFLMLTAVEGLVNLKEEPFDLNVFGDKQLYSWTFMFLYILNKISTIRDFSEDDDVILITQSAWSTTNSGTISFFDILHTVNFFQDESITEYYKPKNCFDALQILLTAANARITYYGPNRYMISSIDSLISNDGIYLGYTKAGANYPLNNVRTITVDGFDPNTDNILDVDYVAKSAGASGWLPAAKRIDLTVKGDSIQYSVGRGTTWDVDDQGNKVLGVLSENSGKKIRVSFQAYLPRTFGGSPIDQYAVFDIVIKSNGNIWQIEDNSGTIDVQPYQFVFTDYDGPETKFQLRAKTKPLSVTDLELYEQFFIINEALFTGTLEMSVTFAGYEYPDGATMSAFENWKARLTSVVIVESSGDNYTELLSDDLTIVQVNNSDNNHVIKESTSFASIATQVELFEKIPKDSAPPTLLNPVVNNVTANGFTGNIEGVLMNAMLKLMMKSVKYYSGTFKALRGSNIPRIWNRIIYRDEVYIPLTLTTVGATRTVTGIFAKLNDNETGGLEGPSYPQVFPTKQVGLFNQVVTSTFTGNNANSSFYQVIENVESNIVTIEGYTLPSLNDVTLSSARRSIMVFVEGVKYFLVSELTKQNHVEIKELPNELEFAVPLRGARVEVFIRNEFELNQTSQS